LSFWGDKTGVTVVFLKFGGRRFYWKRDHIQKYKN